MNYFFRFFCFFRFLNCHKSKAGAKCRIFATGAICNHTTPTTPTEHTEQAHPDRAHPEPTPTRETAASAILKGHQRHTPEAAEPPTEERPDPKTPNHHQDKRQQNDRGTTRTDRQNHQRQHRGNQTGHPPNKPANPYNRQDNRPP